MEEFTDSVDNTAVETVDNDPGQVTCGQNSIDDIAKLADFFRATLVSN